MISTFLGRSTGFERSRWSRSTYRVTGKDVGDWTHALSSCKFPVSFCPISTSRATWGGDETLLHDIVSSLEFCLCVYFFLPTGAAGGRKQRLLVSIFLPSWERKGEALGSWEIFTLFPDKTCSFLHSSETTAAWMRSFILALVKTCYTLLWNRSLRQRLPHKDGFLLSWPVPWVSANCVAAVILDSTSLGFCHEFSSSCFLLTSPSAEGSFPPRGQRVYSGPGFKLECT